MPTFRRRVVNIFTRVTGLNITHKGQGWELFELETLSRFLSEFQVDCVFDVGANIGQYARRLRQIGFRGLIISFEPNPGAFARLEIAAKADPQWITKQIALDSESRTLTFNLMKRGVFSSLHEPDHSETRTFVDMNVVERQVPVLTETLDALFSGLQEKFHFSSPFLKMDTQGHDLDVFVGASKCLNNFVGLQSELGLTKLYKGASTFSEALAFYQSRGFKLSGLIPSNPGHFPDLHEIDCVMYNSQFKGESHSRGPR
jgi:FkbM family methyltransferase